MTTIRVRLADGSLVDATPVEAPAAGPVTADNVLQTVSQLLAGFNDLRQRVTHIEAGLTAEDGAIPDETGMPAPMKSIRAMRRELAQLKATTGEQAMKLAKRLGLEFAARSGANPLENALGEALETAPPANGSLERNEAQLRNFGIGK